MTNYLIIDDEYIAHDIIKGYCDLLPNYNLVKNCYDAIEALECLKNNSVDLIFLDLNMPKLKGFDFLKTLTNPPKVIVTTAYKEYALEGYELNIVDYLLKPFSFERFVKAIQKTEAVHTPKTVSAAVPETTPDKHVIIKSNKKYYQILLDDLLYIEAVGNYCKIVTEQEELTIREKISDLLTLFPKYHILQVHKSFLVAKRKIKSVEGNRIFINKHIIPIGKVYKINVKEFLSL
ncbi:LytTR family DNA-binding domain-containing protein [uncultured Tenacibaculum sp.]|uniref:LytR/AlgR family response regulator transcription factor n=1 Tax=uncultured Tenacibaculum sp. TaxID=174713 RepID=UPI002625DA48|nr:LytTR family DNA-binding domain-containing protein [uncultured Tenacibaculum sp.]